MATFFLFTILSGVTLLQWLGLLAVSLCWFYWHMTKEYGVWEKKGLFSVRPKFFVGNNWPMISGKKNFNDFYMDAYNERKHEP